MTSNVVDEDDVEDSRESRSRQTRSRTQSPTHIKNSGNGTDNGERNIKVINEEDEDEEKSGRDEEEDEDEENEDDNQQYDDNDEGGEDKEVKKVDNDNDASSKNRSQQEADEEDEDEDEVEADDNKDDNEEKMETDDKAESSENVGKNDKSKDCEDDNDDDDKKENDKDDKNDSSADNKRDSRKRKRSRSRSGTRSPVAKRLPHRNSPAKNIDDFTNDEDEPEIDPKAVTLNWVDSDLFLKLNSRDFCSARPITEGVLGLAWAGARATYGVKEGKVAYEIQITDQNRIVPSLDSRSEYELRCGWSISKHDLQLGESPLSFAYGGSAHKATNNEFSAYGCKFGVRDIIGVYLDLDSTPCKIEYTVNGESQGVAFEFDKSELEDKALYPHISTKNLSFKVNFGQCEKLLLSEIRQKSRRHESSRDRRERRRSHDRHRDGRGGHSEDDKSHRTSESDKKKGDECADADKNGDDDKDDKEKSQNDDDDDNKSNKSDSIRNEKTEADEGDDAKNETNEKIIEEEVEENNEAEQKVDDESKKDNVDESKNDDVDESKKDDEDIEMKDDESNENKEQEDKKETDTTTAGDATTENVPAIEKTLLPDYILIGLVSEDKLIIGPVRALSRNECEVIVLIGLPGAGKTYWAENYANEHIEKRFNILGTKTLLDKMKVLLFSLLYFFYINT